MGFQLDHSADAAVWDNVEDITWDSIDGMRATLSDVLRIELSTAEKATSGGAYAAASLNWLIPTPSIQPGRAFSMGDTVTDADGNSYIVQNFAGQVHDGLGAAQVWRLTSLNLSIVYNLRDLIDIQRAGITFDAAGALVKTWLPAGGINLYASLPSRVQLLSKELTEERGVSGFKGTHAVYVSRQVPLVTYEDRIKWTDAGQTYYLNIVGVRNPERLDELPILDAVLAV